MGNLLISPTRRRNLRRCAALSATLFAQFAACKSPKPPQKPELDVSASWVDPEADAAASSSATRSTLEQAANNPNAPEVVVQHATILTATGTRFSPGTIVLRAGAIAFVGPDAKAPTPAANAVVIDGTNKFVTPGIIDAHSHIGVYAAPSSRANNDGNEATAPVTAQAQARYAYAAHDPQISRAMAGGVTTALILPGSANLIGGRGFTVAMKPSVSVEQAAFPNAPKTIKMACGENPKRVYGEKGGPSTRMGEYAAFRAAFAEAQAYQRKLANYARDRATWLAKRQRAEELNAAWRAQKGKGTPDAIKAEPAPEQPVRDLKLETLAGVLRGDILVQIHCYKATDIEQMMAIADEFGFKIRSFHHALEAYKIRDQLVARNIAINTWADWWGFKHEAFDGIMENAALFTESGGRATIHSDSPHGIQRLNQEAAKALAAGRAAGVKLSDDDALRWITINPAWVLGIDAITGSLEAGKRADITMWSGSPFSVYSRAELVFSVGELVYDRSKGLHVSDFELGNSATDRGEP